MENILGSLFRTDYMPHGHCYWWKPEILWLNVVSDLLIAVSYFSIPIAIYYFVKKRKDIQFRGVALLFSAFILLCGITHIVGIIVIWHGTYGIHGLTKFATAIISCITAYQVFKSMPAALKIPTTDQLTQAFENANQEKLERLKVESQREQDAILRESTDSAHVGIIVVNKSGLIEVANKAVCRIFHYRDATELEGKHINSLVEQSVRDKHTELVSGFMREEDNRNMAEDRVVYGISKRGIKIPIEVRLTHTTYHKEPMVFVSLQDISERLRIEAARQASENATQQIIASFPFGLHIFEHTDSMLRLTQSNQAADRMLGYDKKSQGGIIGRSIKEIFPMVSQPSELNQYIETAIEGKTFESREITFIVHGQARVFEISGFQSNPGRLILVFNDITQKKHADIALRQKEKLIERALNASIAGVFVFNMNRRQNQYINERYTDITGYSQGQLQKAKFTGLIQLVHPEDRRRLMRHYRQLMRPNNQAHIFTLEYRFKHANGHWIWLLARHVGFDWTDRDKMSLLMGSFLDITPLKNMQNNLLELKDKAEKANTAKSEFLANMSHEIRTPMNAILGLTQLLRDMELGHQQRNYLAEVHASSRLLLQLLNDVLDYSKLEAGKMVVLTEPFDLYQTVSDSFRLFSVNARDKKLHLYTDITPDTPRFFLGDSVRIGQILNNLIGNAIKFTQSGNVLVRLRASQQSDANLYTVKCDIVDTGIGIKPDMLEQLFESFTQADSSIDRRFGGTGLGLSICKRLTSLLGGEISVTSEPDVGSTFTLTLPLQACAPNKRVLRPDITNLRIHIATHQTDVATLAHYFNHQPNADIVQSTFDPSMDSMESIRADVLILDISEEHESLAGMLEQRCKKMCDNKQIKQGVILITRHGFKADCEPAQQLDKIVRLITPYVPSDIDKALMEVLGQNVKTDNLPSHQIKFENCRVLLVEDNPTNQFVATEMLQKCGITPLIASDGDMAIDIFKRAPIDIILMDLQMPVMDGFAATRAIRQLTSGKTIPIVAMSAATTPDAITRVKECGMNGHIPKPVDYHKLINTLQTYLPEYAVIEYEEKPETPVTVQLQRRIHIIHENIHGANTHDALKRLDGDVTTFIGVLKSFAVQYNGLTGDEVCERDQSSRHRFMHSLKGLSMTVGDEELSATCAMYEQMEIIQNEHIHTVFERLDSLLVGVNNTIAAIDATPDIIKSVRSTNTLSLDELVNALERYQYFNEDDIDQCQQLLSAMMPEHELIAFVDAISVFDFQRALSLVTPYLHRT